MEAHIENALDEALPHADWLTDADGVAIEAARSLARAMDELMGDGDPQLLSKGAYLAPHLKGYLGTLGMTPEGRKVLDIADRAKADGIDELKQRRRQQRSA